MGENVRSQWAVSRVSADTLALLEDDERRCLDLSSLQCSILRQMTFPWATFRTRLVTEHPDYWEIVDQPTAYKEALEELEILLSGAYDGPKGGCPVGEVFHDRGDLPGYDFTQAQLTKDSGWHELDLTNVVGDLAATRVKIRLLFTGLYAGEWIAFREAGNIYDVNATAGRIHAAGVYYDGEGDVKMSSAQTIEYQCSPNVTAANIVIRGYWTPAT
jgi:hypothetical protein